LGAHSGSTAAGLTEWFGSTWLVAIGDDFHEFGATLNGFDQFAAV
jgi:hypothetical protein